MPEQVNWQKHVHMERFRPEILTEKGKAARLFFGEPNWCNLMEKLEETLFITFHSEDEIIQFVNTCRHYDDAIDVTVGRLSTDAKSILGMLLIEPEKSVKIKYSCYDDENNYLEFREEVMRLYDVSAEKSGKSREMEKMELA